MDTDLPGNSNSVHNISDIMEVINTDIVLNMGQRSDMVRRESPYIRIKEQPASKALRFRYECEGRSAGSIPGVTSTPENKTFPTIEIVGHKGRAVVVVSCVTKEIPYKAHPHNLVGRDGCKKGVCTVEVNNDSMTMSFDHLGIQCVKKKDIEEALKVREGIRVDPFRQGFAHRTNPSLIDLNAVRLCFQVFLENEPGKFKHPLTPVVSDIIYDKKALCDLAICKLSHCSATVAGGLEMILLCEKVTKDDISVVFYEEKNGKVVWEDLGEFSPTQVHKQVAISFRTPKYRSIQIEKEVKVFIQLRRPSDGETSDPLPFLMTPLDSGSVVPGAKRSRRDPDAVMHPGDSLMPGMNSPRMSPSFLVKTEPSDASPSHYPGVHLLSPVTQPHGHRTPSPMDYHPNSVSPNYQFPAPVYQPAHPSPLGACQVSPNHLHQGYDYEPPHHLYYQPPDPSLQNGNCSLQYMEHAGNAMSHVITAEPMVQLNINSKELEVSMVEPIHLSSLSADLANLSCEAKKTTQSQENMSQSLTHLVENAYDQLTGNGHQDF